MQYGADTTDGYLKMLADDWRKERLLKIRDMILAVPGMDESMSYKMLGFHLYGEVFAHLNAQKGFVGVYLGDLENLDPGGAIRGKMDCGKTCLRIRKQSDPGVVATLIRKKAMMRQT